MTIRFGSSPVLPLSLPAPPKPLAKGGSPARVFLFAFLCLLFAPPTHAIDTLNVAQSDPILDKWRWTVFDESDGLAGPVNSVYEDGDNIWFGTRGGVQKYDGLRWTTYTVEDGLVDNRVGPVIRARDGAMWFGTHAGISRLSVSEAGEQDWTTYPLDDGPYKVNALCQAGDGTIWAGHDEGPAPGPIHGIRRFADGKWSIVEPTVGDARPKTLRIIESANGTMWFGTNQGLLRFDGADWTLTGTGRINGIIEASDGSVWATSTRPNEVLRFAPSPLLATAEDPLTRYTADEVGIRVLIGCWQADDGTIWVSGYEQLSRFRDGQWFAYPGFTFDRPEDGFNVGRPVSQGATWLKGRGSATRVQHDQDVAYFSHPDSLRVGPVGPDGSMWFRTKNATVRLLDEVWVRYTAEDGFLDGSVRSIGLSLDGSIWATGTHRGTGAVARFLEDQWEIFTEKDGVIDDPFGMLPTRDGSIWMMGKHGGVSAVSRFTRESWQRFDAMHGFSGALGVRRGYEASDGTVWFSERVDDTTRKDLHRFDPMAPAGQGWARFAIAESLFVGARSVYGFGEWPDGTLWMGANRGIHRIELDALPHEENWVRRFDSENPVPRFSSFVPTEDGMWLMPYHARDRGVLNFDGESWNVLKEEDGLPGDAIIRIFRASDGMIWFVGVRGLSRFDSDKVESGWTRFTSANGIREFRTLPNVTEAEDGTLWMDFDGKQVLRFRYREPPVPETFVEPAVDRVSPAGNILLRWSGATKWNRVASEDLRYRWRLNESDWSETTETDMTLTALDPGAYQFEVYTIEPSTRVDTSPAIHAFIVEAPWWRNPAIAGPGLLLIIGILFQSARVVQRDRRLREANEAMSHANKELFQVNVDLQREQVLERLRGQAQGMQSSEDIGPVVETVNSELAELGIPGLESGIGINLSVTEVEVWTTSLSGSALKPFVTPRDDEDRDASRTGLSHLHVDGDQVKDLIRRAIEGGNSRWVGILEEQWPDTREVYHIAFKEGAVRIASDAPIDESYLLLIKRFGEVFGYAHSRYKELQEKEAQNQELKNQNVLERLRGQAQGMQSSEDISPMAEAVFRELSQLGLPLTGSSINVYLPNMKRTQWGVGQDGRALESHIFNRTPAGNASKAEERGDAYFHLYREGADAKEVVRRSIEDGGPRWRDTPEERWPKAFNLYLVFHKGGNVSVQSEEPIAEEYLTLIKRFGEVFGYAHSRYVELQQKEEQNRRLAVDASVQRLRAEVQSMEQASDFERILSLLTDGLKTVELDFEGCEIDVLDEPTENPTMEHFVAEGFRYTTFKMDASGNVAPSSYALPAPYPSVIERTIERFIAGEPYQGTSEGEAILEVPAGSYGRLRVTSTEREGFAEEEVETLREFAEAVALGYARYLDIRAIQEATQRKSAFLASMSHELRTPMNAIKGFTNLVLRRGKDELSERNQENLEKVSHASDHLLTMINDLLDLSKIEAGRMDVNVEAFDVREMIASACDTVSPLVQAGVVLRHDVAADVGQANTDKARVQQMVINLLSNAVKFTEAGSVRVEVRVTEQENARAGEQEKDLVISVSDTGKGIPPDELPALFDEYRQVEGESESSVQKGTGLGLSITKKFAELLGGSIGVGSEVGKGSSFTVSVPTEYPQ
jgi:signal transduction histidine kinase/ligand-binding sensor domain-containing protein